MYSNFSVSGDENSRKKRVIITKRGPGRPKQKSPVTPTPALNNMPKKS